MHLPRLLFTTAYSDNRKTMLTAGITLALLQRGHKVAYFSCGTDYLAPRINARLLEIRSRILDTYFMTESQTKNQLPSWRGCSASMTAWEAAPSPLPTICPALRTRR